MENQLTKKQKKVLFLIGITGAVYLSFKYLLPLVVPFLTAYLIALGIRPMARFLHKKLKIKEMTLSTILVIVLVVLLTGLTWIVGRQFVTQIINLINNLPDYVETFYESISDICSKMEQTFHMEEGIIVGYLRAGSYEAANTIKDQAIPYVMGKSMDIVKGSIQLSAVLVVTITATLLSVKDLEHFKNMRDRSSFRREMVLVTRRLTLVGGAYLRAQGIILSITITVCTSGFAILGNSYSVLLGVLIGLLDALPIFGTGTVLIPWAIFSGVSGNWFQMTVLIVIYLICNFTREILEARLMGKSMGITPLESLMAMYIGLQLFGVFGLFLGPIGFLIIRELLEIYTPSERQGSL